MKFLPIALLLLFSLHSNAQRTSRSGGRTAASDLFIDPSLAPFYHGVASGDPLQNAVIIWTRITPLTDSPLEVEWIVTSDVKGDSVIKTGKITTDAQRDYTVKVDVTGLKPGTTYFYYFKAFNNYSIIGRTKTLPVTPIDHLKFAVVSCSNYEEGYFNGFARIGERNDLDAVVHLGDYIYEYEPGKYGDTTTGRINEPDHEIVELNDYRKRYSIYRLDKDLRRAHQQHPFITIWDDHESANDAWKDGAENHTPMHEYKSGKVEGDWQERKTVAKKAYFEWIPIRDNDHQSIQRTFQYGDLAEIILLDTRLEARSRQATSAGGTEINDPERTMLGKEQKQWLTDKLKNSGSQWKLIGNQIMFSPLNIGFVGTSPLDSADVYNAESSLLDIWDGYPVERNAIIDTIANHQIDNVVFLTGDIHASFSFDVVKNPVLYPLKQYSYLPQPSPSYSRESGKGSVAVEFVTPSITSDNFDELFGSNMAAGFQFALNNPIPNLGNAIYNPHLKYSDLSRNGYFVLDVCRDSIQADYYFVADIKTPSNLQTFGGSGIVAKNGDNHLHLINSAAGPKLIQEESPSLSPKCSVTSIPSPVHYSLLSIYLNPANNSLQVDLAMNRQERIEFEIYDMKGILIKSFPKYDQAGPGYVDYKLDVSTLKEGQYLLNTKIGATICSRKIIIRK